MLVIIPARGGSKGLPRKNVKLLGGKPMIAHAIAAALQAKTVDRVIVTTEDDEIAAAAVAAGAEVPFRRPMVLAGDDVPQAAACLHAIDEIGRLEGRRYESFAIVQSNSPLVGSEDIDATITLFESSGASAALSLRPADAPIEAVFELDQGARLRNVLAHRYGAKAVISRRQDYGQRYVISGAVVVVRTELMRGDANYFYRDPDARGVPVPAERSVDVDTPHDFLVAEAMLAARPV